jgi:multidrug efflux pump subunit AcrA (membrane-fusion protein)
MILGDLLAQLDDENEAAALILSLGELSLLASAREQAEAEGVDLATYARHAVQRYAAAASGEEWVSAIGALGRAADPGKVFLKRALESQF